MTPPLIINLFGGLVIKKGGKPVTGLVTQKAEVLVAYLACHPVTHSREALAAMFWDGRSQKQALSNLRTLLTSLNRHLRPYLTITRKTMSMNWEQEIWVDVVAFEKALNDQETLEESGGVEAALALYNGDFLEGVFVDESRDTEAWIMVTRERLRRRAVRAQKWLATYYFHHRRYTDGIRYARELVELDPLREGSHRLLMRLLIRDGQQNAALAQYEACRRLLQAELSVSPAEETVDLYKRIRQARLPLPHRLPSPPTPFVGRSSELAAISRQLDDDDCHLLTLAGPGGAGKTRLALQAANERQGSYLNGIFFVNAATLTTADMLPIVIANALELPLLPKQSPRTQLLKYLQEREMLLLLDNFEHLLASESPEEAKESLDLIKAIVDGAPGIQLLVTSREMLHIPGEWVITISGLAFLPTRPTSQSASRPEAIQLFTACAQRVQAGFDPDGDNATAVAHICRLVEGLPLGIELAAASLSRNSPTEIADAIQSNLDFLTTRMRDAPGRHHSLRAVFAHSWALLTKNEQESFSRLSVFRGTFNQEAAQKVAQTTQMILDSLVAKSLLRCDKKDGYSMHQTLRHYAAEKLSEKAADETATRDRHSGYMLRFLQEQEAALMRAEAAETLKTTMAALDDLHSAWRWAAKRNAVQSLADSATALLEFYSLSGLTSEGQRTLQVAIEQMEQQATEKTASLLNRLLTGKARLLLEQGKNESAVATARRVLKLNPENATRIAAHFQAGRALWRLSRYEEAQAQLEQGLALSEEDPQPALQIRGDILRTLGIIAMHRGDYDRAEDYYGRALQADEESDSRRNKAIGLNQLGRIAELKGDFRQAENYFEQALDHFRVIGFRRGECAALINLGSMERVRGKYGAARNHLEQALSCSKEIDNRNQEGLALFNLGILYRLLGEYGEAQEVTQQTLHLMGQIGNNLGEANSRYELSMIALEQNELARAERFCRQALATYQTIESPQGIVSCLNILGRIDLRRGDYETAETYLEKALNAGREIDSRHAIADTTGILSRCFLKIDRLEAALVYVHETLELAEKTGVHRIKGEALTVLGHALAEKGDLSAAQEAYEKALALRRECGQQHLTPEPLAGLAGLALAEEKPEGALAHVNEILSYLADHSLHGPEDPLFVYRTCHHVLQAVGDPRTSAVQADIQKLARLKLDTSGE